MRKMKVLLPVAAIAGLLAACSYAQPNPPNQLTPEGTKVKVAERAVDVLNCRSLSKVTGYAASVLGTVDLLEDETVDARNKTAAMGGNTVVKRDNPLPVAEPGSQAFEAFLCQ